MLAHAATLGRGLTCCDGEGLAMLAHAPKLGRGKELTCCDGEGSETLARSATLGRGRESVRSGESVLVLCV